MEGNPDRRTSLQCSTVRSRVIQLSWATARTINTGVFMHLSTKRRVVLGMTTGGLLVGGLGMGIAQADTAAGGAAAGSPGLLSGNLIQVPIDAPINMCGNSISVIGVLDSATGNTCVNAGSDGATAAGAAHNSPGVGSGNLIQVPVNAPINLCGNSISGVGIGDSAADNTCVNGAPSGSRSGSGSGGTTAAGGSHGSPGIGSGNTVQVPVDAPINMCGNSISVVGVLDSATGDTCVNTGSEGGTPSRPNTPPCGCHQTPPASPPSGPSTPYIPPTWGKPHHATHPEHVAPSTGSLAETGTGAASLATPLGAGVLGGGGLMLRKRVSTLHRVAGGRNHH